MIEITKDTLEEIKEWNKKFWAVNVEKMTVYNLVQNYNPESSRIFLKPAYQRAFKWDIHQKSKLIESMILNIPLPSVFLYWDKENTEREVIDWLQRISTVLEFLWILMVENTPRYYSLLEPYVKEDSKKLFLQIKKNYKEIDDLKLERIYLLWMYKYDKLTENTETIREKEMEIENIMKKIKWKNRKAYDSFKKNMFWDGKKPWKKFKYLEWISILSDLNWITFDELPKELKNSFLQKEFNITLLVADKINEKAKYELFYRLNSWWTWLTEQEIRTSLMQYLEPHLYDLININRKNGKFKKLLNININLIENQKDLEYVLRFYALIYNSNDNKILSVQNFIDNFMWKVIDWKPLLPKNNLFVQAFEIIYKTFKENSLKRYNPDKDSFNWSFMLPGFDAIAWWIWYNLKEWNISENCDEDSNCIEKIKKRIKALWMSEQWNKHISATWFVEHKLQVAMFIWRKLFEDIDNDFWDTEEEIAKKIDEDFLEFNKN